MTFGHALTRRVVPVSRILSDVVGPDNALAVEGWGKQRSLPRQGKFREGFHRRARQRVEHVALSTLGRYIVEKCAKLRAAQFDTRIGDNLHQAMQVILKSKGRTDAIENRKARPFLAN